MLAHAVLAAVLDEFRADTVTRIKKTLLDRANKREQVHQQALTALMDKDSDPSVKLVKLVDKRIDKHNQKQPRRPTPQRTVPVKNPAFVMGFAEHGRREVDAQRCLARRLPVHI